MVSFGDFEVFFKKFLDEGYKIVYIFIGFKILVIYKLVLLVIDLLEIKDVYVIDLVNLFSGIVLLVFKVFDLKD